MAGASFQKFQAEIAACLDTAADAERESVLRDFEARRSEQHGSILAAVASLGATLQSEVKRLENEVQMRSAAARCEACQRLQAELEKCKQQLDIALKYRAKCQSQSDEICSLRSETQALKDHARESLLRVSGEHYGEEDAGREVSKAVVEAEEAKLRAAELEAECKNLQKQKEVLKEAYKRERARSKDLSKALKDCLDTAAGSEQRVLHERNTPAECSGASEPVAACKPSSQREVAVDGGPENANAATQPDVAKRVNSTQLDPDPRDESVVIEPCLDAFGAASPLLPGAATFQEGVHCETRTLEAADISAPPAPVSTTRALRLKADDIDYGVEAPAEPADTAMPQCRELDEDVAVSVASARPSATREEASQVFTDRAAAKGAKRKSPALAATPPRGGGVEKVTPVPLRQRCSERRLGSPSLFRHDLGLGVEAASSSVFAVPLMADNAIRAAKAVPSSLEKTSRRRQLEPSNGIVETLHILDIQQGLVKRNDEKPKKLPAVVESAKARSAEAVKRPDQPDTSFKYIEVVRKRADREKLKGFACPDCTGFYNALQSWTGQPGFLPACGHVKGVEGDQGPRGLQQDASRHRYRYEPPSTPEGFWDVGFGDSPGGSAPLLRSPAGLL